MLRLVSDKTVNAASWPPMVTSDVLVKPDPVIVTTVPPPVLPVDVLRDEMVGAVTEVLVN
jgi:hypothetical protein